MFRKHNKYTIGLQSLLNVQYFTFTGKKTSHIYETVYFILKALIFKNFQKILIGNKNTYIFIPSLDVKRSSG